MQEETPQAADGPVKHSGSMTISMLATGLILFAGLLAVLANTGGVMPSLKSDVAAGLSSISQGLDEAGVTKNVIPLTFHDGIPDLLYAGAPECSHCQTFMATGFDAMVEYADQNSLDLVYMPMALSGYGVSIASVEQCALPGATVEPAQLVRDSYAFMPALSATYERAKFMSDTGVETAQINASIASTLGELHKKSGAQTEFDTTCYQSAAKEVPTNMASFTATFGLTGTPSFYHTDESGNVLRTVGHPNLDKARTALK